MNKTPISVYNNNDVNFQHSHLTTAKISDNIKNVRRDRNEFIAKQILSR